MQKKPWWLSLYSNVLAFTSLVRYTYNSVVFWCPKQNTPKSVQTHNYAQQSCLLRKLIHINVMFQSIPNVHVPPPPPPQRRIHRHQYLLCEVLSTYTSCVGYWVHYTSCVRYWVHHTSCVRYWVHYTSCVRYWVLIPLCGLPSTLYLLCEWGTGYIIPLLWGTGYLCRNKALGPWRRRKRQTRKHRLCWKKHLYNAT